MSGAEKDYRFGQKNNWRRRVWNELADRVKHKRDALVLYLAGASDYDRAVAVSKGFEARNMIAVERDRRALEELRERGVNAIKGDFIEVVKAWSRRAPLSVIYGDFCCDLSADLWRSLVTLPAFPACKDTVFAFSTLIHSPAMTFLSFSSPAFFG